MEPISTPSATHQVTPRPTIESTRVPNLDEINKIREAIKGKLVNSIDFYFNIFRDFEKN